MTRNRPHSLLIGAVLIGLVALVVAGCGAVVRPRRRRSP